MHQLNKKADHRFALVIHPVLHSLHVSTIITTGYLNQCICEVNHAPINISVLHRQQRFIHRR
jgi:hypothetical protein